MTRDDAAIVQLVLTNAGFLGQSQLTGSVNYCVNGGRDQPYCNGNKISKIFWLLFKYQHDLNKLFSNSFRAIALLAFSERVLFSEFYFPQQKITFSALSSRLCNEQSFSLCQSLPKRHRNEIKIFKTRSRFTSSWNLLSTSRTRQ